MKKIFTFVAAALLSVSTFAQSPIGIYRPLNLTAADGPEVGDCAVNEAFGVKVTPIRGSKTTYREEAEQETAYTSDLYLGYSLTDAAADNKASAVVFAPNEVIYPNVAEASSRQEDEYFGFTMAIPEGKSVNIDALDVLLLSGNAYQWQVEITDASGNVVYKTQDKGIKINNYNKTAYTNGVNVTTTAVAEPEWSQALLGTWSLAANYDVADTPVLPELKNLTGTYTVKVYYWGKWKKNLTYASVSLVLSQDSAAGIGNITVGKAQNDGVMYNLAGQRIAEPVKGQIYIMNGKKYIGK